MVNPEDYRIPVDCASTSINPRLAFRTLPTHTLKVPNWGKRRDNILWLFKNQAFKTQDKFSGYTYYYYIIHSGLNIQTVSFSLLFKCDPSGNFHNILSEVSHIYPFFLICFCCVFLWIASYHVTIFNVSSIHWFHFHLLLVWINQDSSFMWLTTVPHPLKQSSTPVRDALDICWIKYLWKQDIAYGAGSSTQTCYFLMSCCHPILPKGNLFMEVMFSPSSLHFVCTLCNRHKGDLSSICRDVIDRNDNVPST